MAGKKEKDKELYSVDEPIKNHIYEAKFYKTNKGEFRFVIRVLEKKTRKQEAVNDSQPYSDELNCLAQAQVQLYNMSLVYA